MDNTDELESSAAMEKVINGLFHLGGLMKGFPPTISPSLEDFEFMQFAQWPMKPAIGNFRVLINVSMFHPHEIEIHVLRKKVVEIRGRHDKRQTKEGLWMERVCLYTYDLPPEAIGKELHAAWYDDEVLCIQATGASCEEDSDEVKLVPQRVQATLKPAIEISTMKEMFEDIRDRAQQALRYVRFHTQEMPPQIDELKKKPEVKKEETSSKDDSPSSAAGTSLSPDEMQTPSSEREPSK